MRDADGKVIIKMSLDSKDLDKSLKEEERNLKKYSDDAKELTQLKSKYEADISAYEKERKSAEKLRGELKELRKEYESINKKVDDIYNTPHEEEIQRRLAENPGIIKQRNEILEQYNAKKKELYSLNNPLSIGASEEITKEKELLDDVNARLNETLRLQKQAEQNIQNIKANLKREEIIQSIQNIGKSLTGVIKKVIRWGLAIFGIRGAYMAVRNAINVISQSDAQLKADIDYMKNVMAYALEPVVRRIVDLAKQLLYYLGYLIKMWTNYDIFANANKNLKKATGSAKDLKKQLAGFDEMNTLNDTSGAGGGVDANTMSLDKFAPPKWLQLVVKVGKTLGPVLVGLFAMLFKMKKLGILIGLKGIYDIVKNLIDFIHDPNFQSLMGILKGIAELIIGIGVAIGSWPVLIAGVIAYIIVELVKNIDKVKDFFYKLNDWLDKHVLTWLVEHFGIVGVTIYAIFKGIIDWFEGTFIGVIEGIKKVADGIVKIFKGDVWGGLKDIFGGIFEILFAPFRTWYEKTKSLIIDLLDWMGVLSRKKVSIGGGVGSYGSGGNMGGRAKGGIFYPSKLPKLAVGGIINQPGMGVSYHGATIGERGAEAVVPLTDSQQMALLGEAIGKYVNINATVPVYVGNRMVAREMKRINAEDNFAYNR